MPNIYYLGKIGKDDIFFTPNRNFQKVGKASIIAQVSNRKKETHDELLKLLDFVNITSSDSIFSKKALNDEFKHIDVDEILETIKSYIDCYGGDLFATVQYIFRYTDRTIDGLDYYEYFQKHEGIFDKLSKNYTDKSKEVFFDELRAELLKSKILINTFIFPNGYCTREKYPMNCIYIEGDDLETFLINNKDFYFKEEMFLE